MADLRRLEAGIKTVGEQEEDSGEDQEYFPSPPVPVHDWNVYQQLWLVVIYKTIHHGRGLSASPFTPHLL